MDSVSEDNLVWYECEDCGEEFYFSPTSLPGGPEHCPYCEECSGKLIPIEVD
jgi:DNA-directed RNA polymerase subunit RPC12/RpoP